MPVFRPGKPYVLGSLSADVGSAGPSGTFGVLIVVNGVLVAGSMPVSTGNLPVPRSTAWMGQLDVGDVIAWQKRSSANVTVDTEGTSVGLARIGPVRWV